MRCLSMRMLSAPLVLAASCAFAQFNVAQSSDQPQPSAGPNPDLAEPQLIPTQVPLTPAEKCKKKRHEQATLSVLIDEKGLPREFYFVKALGDDADMAALQAVQADRFNSAQRGGVPVAVRRAVTLDMDVCVKQEKLADGSKVDHLWLLALPVQTIHPIPGATEPTSPAAGDPKQSEPPHAYHVGKEVSAPVPLVSPAARFSDKARRAKYQGVCLLTLIVDQHGMPQNVRVVRPLGMGLDENALEAVRKYRFHPAMKNGTEPVPVMITIEVNFRLY